MVIISETAFASGLKPGQAVRLAVPIGSLVGTDVSPQAAFLLSRVAAEPMTVGELTSICPMTEGECLDILLRFLKQGVIALAERKGP